MIRPFSPSPTPLLRRTFPSPPQPGGSPFLGISCSDLGLQVPGPRAARAECCALFPVPADIYDKVSGEMQKKGYDCECLGGGRISHQSQDKKIHVYGYSMVRPLSNPLPALAAVSAAELTPGPQPPRFPRAQGGRETTTCPSARAG